MAPEMAPDTAVATGGGFLCFFGPSSWPICQISRLPQPRRTHRQDTARAMLLFVSATGVRKHASNACGCA
jgi:hypothetical protein